MKTLIAAAFVAITAPVAFAQPTPDYKPFEYLIGSCWKGTFPDGKQTDEHCFEWMLNKKFFRDRHVVRGGPALYEGESIYSWDAQGKKITFVYYSSDGLVLNGSASPAADSIVFPSKFSTDKAEIELRSVWTRRGSDAYHVLDSQRTPTGWKITREMDYRRSRTP